MRAFPGTDRDMIEHPQDDEQLDDPEAVEEEDEDQDFETDPSRAGNAPEDVERYRGG